METNIANPSGNTKVFGAENLETPTVPTETSAKETGTTKVFDMTAETPKTETKPEVTTTDDKVKESKVEPEAKAEPKNETEPTEDVRKPLKISFNKEPETAEPKEESTKGEAQPLTAEQVLQFIKTQNPNLKEVGSLADLSTKETLPESVAKFKKFVEDTGRENVEDFYNVSKDWKKVGTEERIREYLKLSEPNISDEALQTRMELLVMPDEEVEYLSDREQKQYKIDLEATDRKALAFLEQKSKEYATPTKTNAKPPTPEQIAESYKPYWESRDKALSNLNEVKFDVDGIGEIKIPVTKELKQRIAKNTQTQESFFERWVKEDGTLDAEKSTFDSMWGDDVIRETHLIPEMLNQFQMLLLEAESKTRRNVQLEPNKKMNTNGNTPYFEKESTNPIQDKKFGTPLIRR